MDSIIFSLSSTAHYSPSPPPFATSILAGKHHPSTTCILFLKSSSDSPEKPTTSTSLRRPTTNKPPDITTHSQNLAFSKNPLKLLLSSPPNTSSPPILSNKLWLSNKLSPPPPPPPSAPPSPPTEGDESDLDGSDVEEMQKSSEFREKGKVFIGNLPIWVKKKELTEFFRQFGPIKNVILIKGHHETEMNKGFGFVIYGGSTAEKAAMKAVEFDGVEFHGRVLTVKLDDGRRMKAKTEERRRWVEGEDDVEYRSKWHEEREGSRNSFRKVLDTEPENWQAVVQAFERIKKPSRKEFGLMVNYYGRRGDMHRARETFEKMRARGIEPTVHVYTNLIHAYAVARDMEEALSCVRRMKDEGIEMSLVTHSILVDGFAKLGNIEAAEQCFKEAKERYLTLNAIIYGSIIYANCQTCNMDRAEELVREMEEEGIDAPIDIYHIMMDGYTSIGNEDKCLILFDRLKECGFTPSVVSYGCLMNLFIKVGKVSKAFEVSEMMKLAGIKHNMKTYSMLINGFINLKDWANAFAIFEDVIRDGLKPDVVLYNNIIRAFCGMGNIERAVRIVEEMKKERHRPTSRTFMPIIHAFAKAGEIRKALDVFDMMRRSGCIPTVQTFNALILGLVEKLQMEKAVQVLDEMLLAGIRPNERTYTTIMDGYASLGDTGKAFEYFSRIKDEGLELDIYTYEALLKACCKAGRMQSALAVTKEMSAKNIPRNTYADPKKVVSFVGMHLDVVPANPDEWEFDPFSLSIDGDKLQGRGTTDCLGHVALVTELMKRLGETKPKLTSTVIAIFIASEENSSIPGIGVDALYKDHWFDKLKSGPLYWIDAADKQPCIGTGGTIPWKLEVIGKGFHSGLPNKAINALELAMDVLKEIQSRFYRDFPAVPKEQVYKFETPSTMKPTQWFYPGGGINQIPGECTVSGDVRLTPFYNVPDVMKKLQEYVDDLNANIEKLDTRGPVSKYVLPDENLRGRMTITFGETSSGVACDLNSLGYKVLSKATEEVVGYLEPYSITGSLPLIRDLQDIGYDVQSTGYGLMDTYHAKNEYCLLSDMSQGYLIFASIIAQLED